MLVLVGIAVVVFGFIVRANPLLVVMAAAMVTGLAAAWTPDADLARMWEAGAGTLALFGKAFNDNRFISLIWMVLIVIGVLERSGLQERARMLIARIPAATSAGVIWVYLIMRQALSALGLTSLGGHAQMVRPLVAPMAEGAAENLHGELPAPTRERIKAMAAASDNVGMFFGEDVFVAIGSILLIRGFLEQNGIVVEPLQLARWAIPTALVAFVVHGTRLLWLDRRVRRDVAAASADGGPEAGA